MTNTSPTQTIEELRRNNQVWQTELQSMLGVLRDTERELTQWHEWRLSTNPDYADSEGAKVCGSVLSRAREKILSPHAVQVNLLRAFAESVSRSACLDQRNGDHCICFACTAQRLLAKSQVD